MVEALSVAPNHRIRMDVNEFSERLAALEALLSEWVPPVQFDLARTLPPLSGVAPPSPAEKASIDSEEVNQVRL